MQPSQQQKARAFRALHEFGVFVIPNPWDAGSAKVLAALGFAALASTSSGFAFTLGRSDGAATLDEVVEHARALDEATPLPVSVDLENGYGSRPQDATLADVVYAPGLRTPAQIRAVCQAVSRPVNVLARPGLTVAEIAEAGARRISVGGALAWTAVTAMIAAAERLRDDGDFSGLAAPSRIRELLDDAGRGPGVP